VNLWLLVGISAAVLYGLWLLLAFTFTMIDRAHDRAREPRNAGAKPARGKVT